MRSPAYLKRNPHNQQAVYLILEEIRSLYNVGALFRLADATQVKKIFLIGKCGIIIPNNPKDKRQAVLHPKIQKTALGTQNQVLWQHFWQIKEALKCLPQKTQILALEQTPQAFSYFNFNYQLPLALIVGNEINGVSQKALRLAKAVIQIPMLGQHNSLNVSCAAAVVLYKILEKTHSLA